VFNHGIEGVEFIGLTMFQGALCTSCERPYAVSPRRAQWAQIAFGQEENSINNGPKTAHKGCFQPILIEFSQEIASHTYWVHGCANGLE
jgi:hypothetical protein